jgi:hypothetical protein
VKTHATKLEGVVEAAQSFIMLEKDLRPSEFEVVMTMGDFRHTKRIESRSRALLRARGRLREFEKEIESTTKAFVHDLGRDNLKAHDIAALVGLSRQRVAQILNEPAPKRVDD